MMAGGDRNAVVNCVNIPVPERNEQETLPNDNYNERMLALTVKDETGNNIDLTFDTPKKFDRGGWGGKFDFIMTCIGYAVGLGNVWRFPYLCYKNGGGAFLIPYCLMLLLLGLPLFFLEFAFGQFASLGPISVWNISPLFKGIGYAMVLMSWILVIYYQVVVAHCIYFLVASFTSKLPWTNCDSSWSSSNCVDSLNSTVNLSSVQNSLSPSEDYYYNHVLGLTNGIENFGSPSWKLSLCLLFCWTICALAIIKGVQSLGKVSYFTGIFPYIMLTILLIRSSLLPGSFDGIKFYLTPEFSRLLDPRVWVDAATQIFFSLGCCNGGLIAMSSFNKFKNNCCRDAVIVAFINCATSVYAGFVIFANLGFMAHVKNSTVHAVARSGPGLAFVVYPEAMTNMPVPSLWSVFFFIMMCTLGFGSQFSILETVISGIQDELRRFGMHFTTTRQIIFRASICVINFFLGFPMVFGGGYYLFYLIDNFMAGYPLLFVALCETIVICYIYGLRQFRRDVELMINERPNWYWRICWLIITPLICLSLIIFLFVAGEEFHVDSYHYPAWALGLGNMLAASPMLLIPLWFLFKYCREGGFILLKEFLKPVHEWGPAQKENRAEFISMIKSNESLHRSKIVDSNPIVASAINGSQLQLGFGLGGSVISGLAGTGIIEDTKFFQSKLSVAEKLTQAHTKEIVKRAASNADFGSVDALGLLTASQTALAAASSAALYALGHVQPGFSGNMENAQSGSTTIRLPEQLEENSSVEDDNELTLTFTAKKQFNNPETHQDNQHHSEIENNRTTVLLNKVSQNNKSKLAEHIQTNSGDNSLSGTKL